MTYSPAQSFPGNGWSNSPFTPVWQGNLYQSEWPASTSQNPNWSTNWHRPLGISNVPLGMGPQPQPALLAPYTLQQNSQPLLRPQLPTQPNPNPNNRPVQLVQLIENPKYEIEQKECNEIRLRSRCVITPEENRDQPSMENVTPLVHIPSLVHVPPLVNNIKPKHGEETDQHEDPEKIIVTSPPFPKRLTIPKSIAYPDFDLVGELKNLCIKIPLL